MHLTFTRDELIGIFICVILLVAVVSFIFGHQRGYLTRIDEEDELNKQD